MEILNEDLVYGLMVLIFHIKVKGQLQRIKDRVGNKRVPISLLLLQA